MKTIALTCGDPSGVGPDVIRTWLERSPNWWPGVTVIGARSWLSQLPNCGKKVVGDLSFSAVAGEPDEAGAALARDALEHAAIGCREGLYRAVVTAPISKEWMQRIGWSYPGHTEFFGDLWHGAPSMAFAGGKLAVVLATWHIPLERVPSALDRPTLERAVRSAAFLGRRLGAISPRIGVCGLNPHAGEGGLLGWEEDALINPVLDELRDEFSGLSRALPADTLFWRQMQGDFDVIVAMYHDQGLAPLKAVDFDSAVNITLGLPFVRTSPDHGTAYHLAGSGRASDRSFGNAVELADRLSLVQ